MKLAIKKKKKNLDNAVGYFPRVYRPVHAVKNYIISLICMYVCIIMSLKHVVMIYNITLITFVFYLFCHIKNKEKAFVVQFSGGFCSKLQLQTTSIESTWPSISLKQ